MMKDRKRKISSVCKDSIRWVTDVIFDKMRGMGLLLFLMLSNPLQSQDVTKVATTIGTFLKLDVGARAASVGGAYVALANDATTMAWNPAGMAAVGRNSLAVSHSLLYAGISHSYIGYVRPLNSSNYVGISLIYLNSGEMEVTTVEFDEGLGEYFIVSDLVLGISYARKMTDFLSLGVTVKYIREQIYREVAQTFAFDIGSYFNTGVAATILGMSITNFGGEMKLDGPDLEIPLENTTTGLEIEGGSRYSTEKWPLPLTFRMGIRTDFLGGINQTHISRDHRLSFLANASDPLDHTMRISIGMEYEWRKIVSVRMGKKYNGWRRYTFAEYQDDDQQNAYVEYPVYDENGKLSLEGLAFGAGIHYGFLQFDYALVNFGLLNFVHQLSLQIQF